MLISALPPPYGGVASLTEPMMRLGPAPPFRYHLVDTTIWPRKLFEPARLNWSEVRRVVRILRAVHRGLRQLRPGIVHLNFTPTRVSVFRDFLLVAMVKTSRARLVVHFHGDLGKFAAWTGLRRWLLRSVLLRSNVLLVMSRRSEVAAGAMVACAAVEYVPNFIESLPNLAPRSCRTDSSVLRVVFVGAVCEAKGILELVEAVAATPGVLLEIIGQAVESIRPALDSALSAEGPRPRVTLRGVLCHAEVMERLRENDVFCLPSHVEGFPVSVLEAMGCGLAVVGTRVGAIPDIVEDGVGGFVVECKSPALLAEKLRLLRDEPNLCVAMGQHNRTRVQESFTYDRVRQQLAAIYRKLLAAS